MESNVKPCKDAVLVEIKGSLPVSRFMVVEIVERQPFEPEIVGYLRVDPPVPLMHRRINGEIVSRVVIHPDCRGDRLGRTIVRSAIEWVDGCDVPEMRKGNADGRDGGPDGALPLLL